MAEVFNGLGASIVVVATALSLLHFWWLRKHESDDNRLRRQERDAKLTPTETIALRLTRRLSRTVAEAAFPINFLAGESGPPSSDAQRARDNRVDLYVYGWAAGLLLAGASIGIYELITQLGAGAATILAWICAYRVIDIVVSRADILTNSAGEAPFSLSRARRSLVGSIVVLGQVIVSFAIMFDGWTNWQSAAWPHPHLLLGFAYISTRVIFTLGPPEDPVTWFPRLLVGAEVVCGFAVIGLGIAEYLGALRNREP